MLIKKYQSGVMLLEALIGVLIFSIGIIAMMGLQANALATVSETKYRSEAAFLAEQFISDIRNDAAFASSINPLLFPVTTASESPYTLNASNVPSTEDADFPTIVANPSEAEKLSYLPLKIAYSRAHFYNSLKDLPGTTAYPPKVEVTPCIRSSWTAASPCPQPTTGVLGQELYGAIVDIVIEWKLPTASPTSDPRRHRTAAYVMLEAQ